MDIETLDIHAVILSGTSLNNETSSVYRPCCCEIERRLPHSEHPSAVTESCNREYSTLETNKSPIKTGQWGSDDESCFYLNNQIISEGVGDSNNDALVSREDLQYQFTATPSMSQGVTSSFVEYHNGDDQTIDSSHEEDKTEGDTDDDDNNEDFLMNLQPSIEEIVSVNECEDNQDLLGNTLPSVTVIKKPKQRSILNKIIPNIFKRDSSNGDQEISEHTQIQDKRSWRQLFQQRNQYTQRGGVNTTIPIGDQEEQSERGEGRELSKIEEEDELSDTEEQNELSVIEEQDELSNTEEQNELSEIDEQDELSDTEEQNQLSEIEEQDELSDTEEQNEGYGREINEYNTEDEKDYSDHYSEVSSIQSSLDLKQHRRDRQLNEEWSLVESMRSSNELFNDCVIKSSSVTTNHKINQEIQDDKIIKGLIIFNTMPKLKLQQQRNQYTQRGGVNTTIPIGDQEEQSERGERRELSKIEEEDELSDTEEQNELSVIEEQDELSDTEEQNELSEIEEQDELSDTEEQNQLSEIEEQDELSDTEEQNELSEVEEQNEVSVIEEQDELSEIEEQDELSEIEEQDELSEIAEQDELSEIEEQDELSDTEEQSEISETERSYSTDSFGSNHGFASCMCFGRQRNKRKTREKKQESKILRKNRIKKNLDKPDNENNEYDQISHPTSSIESDNDNMLGTSQTGTIASITTNEDSLDLNLCHNDFSNSCFNYASYNLEQRNEDHQDASSIRYCRVVPTVIYGARQPTTGSDSEGYDREINEYNTEDEEDYSDHYSEVSSIQSSLDLKQHRRDRQLNEKWSLVESMRSSNELFNDYVIKSSSVTTNHKINQEIQDDKIIKGLITFNTMPKLKLQQQRTFMNSPLLSPSSSYSMPEGFMSPQKWHSEIQETHRRECCKKCKSDCNVWEFCEPVKCVIDQNEVEIIPYEAPKERMLETNTRKIEEGTESSNAIHREDMKKYLKDNKTANDGTEIDSMKNKSFMLESEKARMKMTFESRLSIAA